MSFQCTPLSVRRNILHAMSWCLVTCGFNVLSAQQDTCTIGAGDFRTQTQGGWGIEDCTGDNPGCYRDAHFDVAFPDGLTIGCSGGDQWTFTGTEAIAAFLPQFGPSALLGENEVNPTEGAGVLGGQLVAAKLSLGFDAHDDGFGEAGIPAGTLVYSDGPYAGWSVSAVVMLADMVVGGCLPFEDNLSSLVEALTSFNEAFVDGDMAAGTWEIPGCNDDGGGDDDGGGENGGGDGEDDCDEVCTLQLSCPQDTTLGCGADAAAEVYGFPAVAIFCCPAGAPIGSSECTTLEPSLTWSWTDVSSGNCPVTVERTFTATLSGAEFDTVITCTQLLFIEDTVAPEITCPADLALECGDPMDPASTGFATANDACGTVVVTYSDFTLTPASGDAEGIARFWTATDACGNTAFCTQNITVPDATPPAVSIVCPPDTTLEFTGDCGLQGPFGLFGEPEVTVTDAVDLAPTVTFTSEDAVDASCAGTSTVTRTWIATATDACGNAATASCQQTITYMDAEPPVFANLCDLTEGQQFEVCCAPDGTIDIPAPCLVTASDNCQAVEVIFSEAYSSHAPEPGAQQACSANEPIAFEDGLTCEGDTTHVLRLFCFPGTDEQVAFFTAAGSGNIQYFDDATWSLTWRVAALDDDQAGFDISATFTDGVDWAGWNSRGIPSGFKGECTDLAQAQTWMYFLLSEGTLTGWGRYEGSTFSLAHQPESTFYGTQVGEGANQHSAQYGFGSTLTYSGQFVEDGVVVAADIHCCGDLHGEIECCLPFSITRTYTATDCAGNTAEFSYQITSSGDPCPEAEGSTADRVTELPEGRSGAIILTGMAPNPAEGDVNLRFAVEEPLEVEAAILNLSGQVVRTLGARSAEPGVEESLNFNVGDLPAGLYQLRLTAPDEQASRSLFVVH